MCVICISPKGIRQPNKEEFQAMFSANPHGAGYMFINDDALVEIHKGFMTFDDFWREIKARKFTKRDVVIYHFRIATQARRHEMCHPFPLTDDETELQAWDTIAEFGVAHNGIIDKTSNGNPMLSDTALYIRDYLAPRIASASDITPSLLDKIESETGSSKIAIMDGNGQTWLTGKWIYDRGLLYSNDSYQDRVYRRFTFNDVDLVEWGK